VLSPSHTLLITSADKEGERKNKDKGGKRHAASPRRVLPEVVEPIVPLPCLFFLLSLFFLNALLYLFFFVFLGETNRGNLCRPTEMGAAKRSGPLDKPVTSGRHADHFAGTGSCRAAYSRNDNRKQGRQRKINLWRLGLGENKEKKKNTEISNENNDVSTPI
jgi:hypothetical protein